MSDHENDRWYREEYDSPNGETFVRTEVKRQFWRESEQEWVDNALIRTWGANADKPRRWRHRVTTVTTHVGEWTEGQR